MNWTTRALVALLILVLLVPVLAWALRISRAQVTVVNGSGKQIAVLTIAVDSSGAGSLPVVLGPLAPGASRIVSFKIDRDSGFQLRGMFADGTPISGDCGYVERHWLAYHLAITVGPKGGVTGRERSGVLLP